MDPAFWLMSFALLCLQSVVNILTAVVLYRLVVMQREAMQSYIIGYRDVIPVLFCLPLWLGSLLDIRNMAFMACLAFTSPAILSFRCIKAMHNTVPRLAYDETNPSLSRFLVYNVASIQFKYDQKTEKAVPFTRKDAVEKMLQFGRSFLETTLLYLLLLPFDYAIPWARHLWCPRPLVLGKYCE